jgi:hypothetical protein
MTPTKMLDDVLSTHDLPLELRRAWTVHRSEDARSSLMLTGVVVGNEEQDDVISPYLLRQNLVVPAYPFRTGSPALHEIR